MLSGYFGGAGNRNRLPLDQNGQTHSFQMVIFLPGLDRGKKSKFTT